MEYEIEHNLNEERFEASSNKEILGVANYEKDNDVIIVTHTGVRSEYEGQGIAAALTKEILNYIKENGLKVIPLCSYTQGYIERHEEYLEILKTRD